MTDWHTPGPWRVADDYDGAPPIRVEARLPVAGAMPWAPIARLVNEAGPTGQANARLIAAAPEMLEALRSVVDDIGGVDAEHHNALLEQISAAIKRATGEEIADRDAVVDAVQVDPDPHFPDLRRIAVALERIAAVLEKEGAGG